VSAEDLLRDLESESPALVRLAEAVSLAALVDPPLLRRARLTLVPEADAGLEAELWLSPLIQTRGPQGIVFASDVAEELRARLGKSSQRLEQAWEITRDLHRHLSPAVRLEEEVAWLSVAAEPDDERIKKLLRKALAALVVGERRGLAHWAARALPRLPARVRETPAARMLAIGAELRLGGGAGIVEERPEWLSWVAPADLPRVPVRVRLLPGQVELEAGATGGESVLQVPRTDPLLIDVLWQDPVKGDERKEVTLRPGERQAVEISARAVQLRTLLGEVYELRPEGLPSRRLADQIIDFSEGRARHRPFFGRERELALLETMVLTSGLIAVGGPTGIGKTAFLARFLDLCEQRGNLPPHHFFRRGDPRLEDLATAERSLVAQIATRFPEIAPTAEGRSLREVLTWLRKQNLFSPEPLVLVLDGLDQIRTRNPDELQRLLITNLPTVVVVSSMEASGDMVKRLVLAPWGDALPSFWEHHGPGLGLGPKEIEIALHASEGNFGLAQVLRGRIESGFRDLSDTGGEQGVFQQIWSTLGERLGPELRDRMMGALAAAQAPLPDSVLSRLLAFEDAEDAVRFTPLMQRRFSKGEPDSELSEEVLRELIAAQVDMKEQHRRLAEAVTSDLSPEISTPQLREYGFRYGITHWLEAGEPTGAYRLCTDLGFLTAGCREVGPAVVLRSFDDWLARNVTDIWHSGEILEERDPDLRGAELVQRVRDVIAERAPLLQANPEALAGLLYERFRSDGWSRSRIYESRIFSSGLPPLRRKFPAARKNPGPSRHRGSVVGCAFTSVEGPNADLVLSWSTDGTLNLWRADRGELISTLAGHTGEVTGCALLPEERAVSASRDGTLRLWSLGHLAARGSLIGHEGAVLGVAAIDERRVVSWSEDCTIRVWDVEDGRQILVLRGHDRAVTACALVARNRSQLVSGSTDATVRLWNLDDGRLLRTYRSHQAAVTGVVVTRDGRHAFSCSLDRTVRMWSLRNTTSSPAATFEGHSLGVLGLALSPRERSLASWSYDRTVRIWNLPEGRLLSTLTGHTGAVLSCAFLSDTQLVSGSADRTLRLWRISLGELAAVLEGHEGAVRCLAIEPRKKTGLQRISSGSDDRTLRLWDSDLCLETTSLGGGSHEISLSLAASRPGRGSEYVLFGDRRGSLEIRNVEEEEPQRPRYFASLKLPMQGGVIDAQHHYMVAWGWDGGRPEAQLRVLDLKEDPDIATLKGHQGPVLACAFTSTSDRLLSASIDHTICIWSVNPVRFEPIGVLQGHTGPVSDIRLDGTDHFALSASWDRTLRLWSLGPGYSLLRIFEGHTDRVLACAFSPEGLMVVSASADQTLRLWGIDSGKTLQVFSGHNAEVTGCAVTSDAESIVSRSLDGTLRAWNLETGGVTIFKGHSDGVNAFALDEEQGLLYSCSEDRTVRAWDFATGEPAGIVYGVAPFRSLSLTRAGVCAGDEAGNFWVLERDPERPSPPRRSSTRIAKLKSSWKK
jgi:WD40 repeat protein